MKIRIPLYPLSLACVAAILSPHPLACAQQSARLAISETQTTPLLAQKYSSKGPAAAEAGSMMEMLEAIDTQTADRFQTLRMFSVVESDDLNKVIPQDSSVETAKTAAAPAAAMAYRPGKFSGKFTRGVGTKKPNIFNMTFIRVESPHQPAPLINDGEASQVDLRGDWKAVMHMQGSDVFFLVKLERNPDGTYESTISRADGTPLEPTQVDLHYPFLTVKWPAATFFTDLTPGAQAQQSTNAIIGLRDPIAIDLKDPKTAAGIKQKGIQYLLVMTVQDFAEETLDLLQGKSTLAYQNSQTDVRVENQRERRNKITAAARANRSVQAGVVDLDKNVRKQQTVRLSVRYRLFDGPTGALLASDTLAFTTNRIYTSVATEKDRSTGDLFQSAAQTVAEWAAIKVGDTAFPIQVLDADDSSITINRGSDSGVRIGQVYEVIKLGKQLTDPATGDVLGREELKVGRVAIQDFQSKFSKARILSNSGIVIGTVLRLANSR